jgi:hypothetical protein
MRKRGVTSSSAAHWLNNPRGHVTAMAGAIMPNRKKAINCRVHSSNLLCWRSSFMKRLSQSHTCTAIAVIGYTFIRYTFISESSSMFR